METSIQVVYNGQTSAALKQPVATAAPGIFSALSSGAGQAAIANEKGSASSSTAPAAKGSTVVIYITGGGQTDPAAPSGSVGSASPLQRIKAPVTVAIGRQPATILYAGAVPGNIVGLCEINATLPVAIPSGNVPVQVTIGGVTSQSTATIAVQ